MNTNHLCMCVYVCYEIDFWNWLFSVFKFNAIRHNYIQRITKFIDERERFNQKSKLREYKGNWESSYRGST